MHSLGVGGSPVPRGSFWVTWGSLATVPPTVHPEAVPQGSASVAPRGVTSSKAYRYQFSFPVSLFLVSHFCFQG